MNKVILIGRLTRDPEVKTTQNQISVCSFSIAVDRRFKDANGERQADFINCVAWRQQAELLGRYFQKGSRIGIVGNIQTRNYEVEGSKRYVTEVVVDEIEFVESKRDSASSEQAPSSGSFSSGTSEAGSLPTPAPAPAAGSGFFPTMDDDTTLPFDL